MLKLTPYVAFKGNCRDAIELYKSALGAEVLFTQTVGESSMSDMGPAENIMHSTIRVGDSTIMMCDDPRPDAARGEGNISLAIGLDDPERAKQLFENLASRWACRTKSGKKVAVFFPWAATCVVAFRPYSQYQHM